MSEKKIINRMNKMVICVGYRNEYSTEIKPTRDCVDKCIFCHYGKGQHWSDDWIKCHCPMDIHPGEKLRVRKLYTVEWIRKYDRKK